jgi:hypothetical protein
VSEFQDLPGREVTDGSGGLGCQNHWDIDRKLASVRRWIEEGQYETAWANRRLGELHTEREALTRAIEAPGKPPLLDSRKATAYRKDMRRVMTHAVPAVRKRMMRQWVEGAKFIPEERELEIRYRIPEPLFVNKLTSGGRCG